jgi:hypothetical protein
LKDLIFASFLEAQEEQARELARSSDVLSLEPLGPKPFRHFLAELRCRGLVEHGTEVEEADQFRVRISFPPHYLRRAEVAEVVRLVSPIETFHPNVIFPFICLGRLKPGTPLVDIILQCHEIFTYQKLTMREDDALNRAACAWARRNQHRFPIDHAPLRRRAIELRVHEIRSEGTSS